MRTSLKILAAILGFIIVVLIALNIYFNDERLRQMIVPGIQDATGADLQVERLSLTFFRTFPKFGVEAERIFVPDERGDSLFSSEQLLVSVDLFPLLRDELSISRLQLVRPMLFYTVRADSTTNIDFLLSEDEPEQIDEQGGYELSVSGFTLSESAVTYIDSVSNSRVGVRGLDAGISLRFAENIESEVDAELESLSVNMNNVNYFNNLSLSLNQTSTINLDEEILTLNDGFL
ncbi:MAG: AsmA family protein, partial [Balneolaceae bacterium]|nr:AsmA family protein [Balneolaceae bacterium]